MKQQIFLVCLALIIAPSSSVVVIGIFTLAAPLFLNAHMLSWMDLTASVTFMYAYLCVLVAGVPIHLFLLWRGYKAIWSYAMAGLVVGTLFVLFDKNVGFGISLEDAFFMSLALATGATIFGVFGAIANAPVQNDIPT